MAEEKVKIESTGIEIVFERVGDPASIPVFLIMGGGAQLINWPDGFCAELVKHNLYLIRFDNRDVGRSTHFSNAPVPDFAAVMKGDYSTVSYTLSDMALDTIGLMDELGFESVHIVGASMGGMIAQTIAIEYPSRVRSLISIMSTTGASDVGQTDYAVLSSLGPAPYHNKEGFIHWWVRSMKTLGSAAYPSDDSAMAKLAALCWERDHDPLGMIRQAVAVIKSGDRTERLKILRVPSLVIHGDSDKMIDVSGGRATADAIPDAELYVFEGMGHSFPEALWNKIAALMANHILRAEASRIHAKQSFS